MASPTISYHSSPVEHIPVLNSSLVNVFQYQCDWENVSFTDCILDNVVFKQVRLRNVHFYNVDFTNVRIEGVELQNVRWMNETLASAAFTAAFFGPCQWTAGGYQYPLPILARDGQGTRGGVNPRQGQHPGHESMIRSRTCYEIKLVNRAVTQLLDLPANLLEHVMGFLYHKEDIQVIDTPRLPPGQSEYTTRNGSTASYTACQWEAPTLGLKLNFLRASQACYQIGSKAVYDRRFLFLESAESCLAFLHDHRREWHNITAISIAYGPQTDAATFRQLMNVLVHERPQVTSLHMHIGCEFWRDAPWTSGVQAVMNWAGWTVGDEHNLEQRNFLKHVARLAMKTRDQTQDIELLIDIQDVDKDSERMRFFNDLVAHITCLRRQRLHISWPKYEPRVCDRVKRPLHRCCYWG